MVWLIAMAVWFLFMPWGFHQASIELYTDRVTVIAYHHIDDRITGDVTISTERFRGQLADLLQRGYHFITLQQFHAFLAGADVPPNAVLVTFDDGYRSFYTNAYPVLKELGIPAVNFVITKDLDHPLESRVPSLSRDEIREMTRNTKGIDFQCHTDNLHDLASDGQGLFTSRLNRENILQSEPEYEKRIIDDTKRCKAKLSELYNAPIDSFAFPFGIYDERSAGLLQQAEIHYAFTTVSGIVDRHTDPMQIPRINAGSPFIKENSLNNLIIRKLKQSF